MKKTGLIFVLIIIMSVISLCITPAAADIAADGKIVIVIDPGHGGIDGGSGVGTRTEKEYDFDIASYLRDELVENGNFDVYMTRNDDTYLKYLPRALVARNANADLLLSIHCNELSSATYVGGSSAYVSLIEKCDATELAGLMLDGISAAVPIYRGKVSYREDTGDKLGVYYWDEEHQWDMPSKSWLGKVSDYYSMNTWSSKFGIPSIIIEHGYLSNPGDLAVLDSDENLRAIAHAEAEVLIDYYLGHEHDFGELTVDYPSNCSMNGAQSRRCKICGAKSGTEALPTVSNGNGHFWRQTGNKAATCTEDGWASYICQVSYNLNDKGFPCEVHEYTETLKALGHDFEVLENTTGDGRIFKRCRNCGLEAWEDPCNGEHKYEIIEEVAPTCTEDGKIIKKCSACEGIFTEVIPKTGHSFTTKTTPATCTEVGHIETVCEVCGFVEASETISAAHDYQLVSEEKNGVKHYTCSVCGGEMTDESGKLPDKGGINPVTAVVIISAVILVAALGALLFIFLRARKKREKQYAEFEDYVPPFDGEMPDEHTASGTGSDADAESDGAENNVPEAVETDAEETESMSDGDTLPKDSDEK